MSAFSSVLSLSTIHHLPSSPSLIIFSKGFFDSPETLRPPSRTWPSPPQTRVFGFHPLRSISPLSRSYGSHVETRYSDCGCRYAFLFMYGNAQNSYWSYSGLSGLASACALALNGHRVRVIDKTSGLPPHLGAIRVPPNAAKVLAAWGLHDELAQKSSLIDRVPLIDSSSFFIWSYLGQYCRVLTGDGLQCTMVAKRSVIRSGRRKCSRTVVGTSI